MATHQKPVNLGLQGGGAHGAFAWGVLDYLLEDGRLHFAGLTATSAGAMNAVAYAYGFVKGGRDGARESLETFWRAVARAGGWYKPAAQFPFNAMPSGWLDHEWATYAALETITRTVSPYDFNPFNFNPLRDVLEAVIDFDELHHCTQTKLFITATNVRSGKAKVFRTNEVTIDVVLASACLPYLFQAVEIDGEYYWDGGYMGNPSLWPLFYDVDASDLVVVHLNPMYREEIPKRPSEILNRINEISFNASLLKEMRSIAFVQKLLHQGLLKEEYTDKYRDIRFHSIRADKVLGDLSVASKFNTGITFFEELRDRGREAAAAWLDENYNAIGNRSSVELHAEFLDL
ncbi:MAG: patatin-like phospholipase family protein [Pseudomonadota bacterium]